MEETTSMSIASITVDPDRPSLLTLYLDGLPSSALDLNDPEYLEFEYMQHMRLLTDARFPHGTSIKGLHIGGAGCALARALDASHPNSRQLAVEVDEILSTKVREWFPLPRSPRLRIRNAEGRQVMHGQAGRNWDVIVRDAFAEGTVPYHLMTQEAAIDARNALSPDGIYLLNLSRHYKPEIATILSVFDHVVAITDPAIWSGKRYGNIVLGASRTPWPEMTREVYKLPLPARIYSNLKPSASPYHDLPEVDLGLTGN